MTIDARMHHVFKFLFYENGNPPKEDMKAFMKRVLPAFKRSKKLYNAFKVLVQEYLIYSNPSIESGRIRIFATIHFRGKTKHYLGFSGIGRVGNPMYNTNV